MTICNCGRNIPNNAVCFCNYSGTETIVYSHKNLQAFKESDVKTFFGDNYEAISELDYFRFLWRLLHTYKFVSEEETKEWFILWKKKIPCGECRGHFENIIKDYPMDFSNKKAFFESGVKAHNMVNKRLGKPEVSIESAILLWNFEL